MGDIISRILRHNIVNIASIILQYNTKQHKFPQAEDPNRSISLD